MYTISRQSRWLAQQSGGTMAGMRCHQQTLTVATFKQGLYPITDQVQAVAQQAAVRAGLCTVFIRHTSASLLIQENADPSVRADLERYFSRLVPEGSHYEHDAEGPDDMPAHIKAALLPASLSVPITEGALALGAWQGIYIWEHRKQPRRRQIVVQIVGVD